MKKIFLIFALFFLTTLSYAATDKAEVTSLWETANSSYSVGEYNTALETYQKLEKEVGISASLYYNIGNCYFKENKLAQAILYYSKAAKIDPTNDEIKHNLAVANALTTNKIKEVPKFFATRWLQNCANLMSSNGWAQISIFTLAILLAMLIAFLLSKKSNQRKLTFTIGTIALIVTLLTGVASSYQKAEQTDNTRGVIMNNAVAVKSSPDTSGKDIFILNEGVRVQIKEKIGSWSKITISSGDTGWVETRNIEII